MKLRLIGLAAITLALTGAAGWYIYRTFESSAPQESAQAAPQPSVQTVNGETVVTVPPDVQRASHIEVSPLAKSDGAQAVTAYATVLGLQPYFDLRSRLAAARANLDALKAQAGNSRMQFTRSQTLYNDDRNVSRKALQDADSAMLADQAKLKAAGVAVDALTATLLRQFGKALAFPAPDLLTRLQSEQAAVLRVTLPESWSDEAPAGIRVVVPGGREIAAQRLSVSPTADPAVQGRAWLYAVQQALPAGLRMQADIPVADSPAASVEIPGQAVFWYGGQAWAYVKTAPDRFTRRFVSASTSGRDYIAQTGFHAGDLVVTQGAQLLLSEELTPRGVATLCKDPPECDD